MKDATAKTERPTPVRTLAPGEVAEVSEGEMVALAEELAPPAGVFTRRSVVRGAGVTLYSRDGEFWCTSIEEYDRTAAARAERIEALKPGEDGDRPRGWRMPIFRRKQKGETGMGQEPAPGTQAAKILAAIRSLGKKEFELADLKERFDDVQPWTLSSTLHSFAERELLDIVRRGRPGTGNVYRLRDGKAPSSKKGVSSTPKAPPAQVAAASVRPAPEPSQERPARACRKCGKETTEIPLGKEKFEKVELRLVGAGTVSVAVIGAVARVCASCPDLAIEGMFRGQVV